ncbi:GNAT family N-acetyltransferase [Mumia sp. Pv 4-285]|uniref:GNAT family N-acetyltransferase n=1 Tax=Mumia qirimensis TaxID=3234852 RepID=UPI00351D7052
MPDLVTPALPPGTLSNRPQPTFTADGLTVRPWRASDVDALVRAYEDPEIQRWHVRSMTSAEAAAWITSAEARWSVESGAQWAVVDRDDALLGRVGIRDVDLADGLTELGYWTVPAARGQGVAPRALTTVVRWMLDDIGFHRIEIEHSTENPASCRVAERVGFALEATRRSCALHADGWHDMHVHARVSGRDRRRTPAPR